MFPSEICRAGRGLGEWAMAAEHEIRTRSYLLWEAEGRPQGRDMEFWFRAKAQLDVESRAPTSWKRPNLFVPALASVLRRESDCARVAGTKRAGAPIAAMQ